MPKCHPRARHLRTSRARAPYRLRAALRRCGARLWGSCASARLLGLGAAVRGSARRGAGHDCGSFIAPASCALLRLFAGCLRGVGARLERRLIGCRRALARRGACATWRDVEIGLWWLTAPLLLQVPPAALLRRGECLRCPATRRGASGLGARLHATCTDLAWFFFWSHADVAHVVGRRYGSVWSQKMSKTVSAAEVKAIVGKETVDLHDLLFAGVFFILFFLFLTFFRLGASDHRELVILGYGWLNMAMVILAGRWNKQPAYALEARRLIRQQLIDDKKVRQDAARTATGRPVMASLVSDAEVEAELRVAVENANAHMGEKKRFRLEFWELVNAQPRSISFSVWFVLGIIVVTSLCYFIIIDEERHKLALEKFEADGFVDWWYLGARVACFLGLVLLPGLPVFMLFMMFSM